LKKMRHEIPHFTHVVPGRQNCYNLVEGIKLSPFKGEVL